MNYNIITGIYLITIMNTALILANVFMESNFVLNIAISIAIGILVIDTVISFIKYRNDIEIIEEEEELDEEEEEDDNAEESEEAYEPENDISSIEFGVKDVIDESELVDTEYNKNAEKLGEDKQ